AQARLRRTGESAANEKPIETQAVAAMLDPVAREGEEHLDHSEALLTIDERKRAAAKAADGYRAEIEAFFVARLFIVIAEVASAVFKVDDKLGHFGRTPDETGAGRTSSVASAA